MLVALGFFLWALAAFVISWRIEGLIADTDSRLSKHRELKHHLPMGQRADSLEAILQQYGARLDSLEARP